MVTVSHSYSYSCDLSNITVTVLCPQKCYSNSSVLSYSYSSVLGYCYSYRYSYRGSFSTVFNVYMSKACVIASLVTYH